MSPTSGGGKAWASTSSTPKSTLVVSFSRAWTLGKPRERIMSHTQPHAYSCILRFAINCALIASATLIVGCATTARWKCETIYCDPEPCAAEIRPIVTECIEKEIERKRTLAGYFANLGLSLAQTAASVF